MAADGVRAMVPEAVRAIVDGLLFPGGADDAAAPQDVREVASFRWVAIFLSLVVFFNNVAAPLVAHKKTVYMDLRVGLLIWLFAAATLHTPVGSSEVEDHPTLLFGSVFVLLLVVTHLTLAAFTVLHHMFAWFLGLVSPRMAETLWVPALRSMRSFRTILKASVLLSGSLSSLFAYCETMPAVVCAAHPDKNNTPDHCANAEPATTFIGQAPQLVCGRLLNHLDKIWAKPEEVGNLEFAVFGIDVGRLSLLESPIGLLWLSGIALWATYYTLRRTKQINQRLQERERKRRDKERRNTGVRSPAGEDDDADSDEGSEDEYEAEEPAGDLASSHKGKSRMREPTNFLPMAEWYSLALTETAFQLLVSMKLFLGRFDMRTMQAALKEIDDDMLDDEDSDESDSLSDGSEANWRSAHGRKDRGRASRGSDAARLGDRARGRSRKPKAEPQPFDSRYADLDEMWFDFIADTGDGGNSTYAVARAAAQPELRLPKYSDEDEESARSAATTSSSKSIVPEQPEGANQLETLKRGDLLILGGDLAYPTPSKREYDQRLFVPFEYALEGPPSYHRDDISTTKRSVVDDHALVSRLSFVAPPGNPADLDTSQSLPFHSKRSKVATSRTGRSPGHREPKSAGSYANDSAELRSPDRKEANEVGMFQIGSSASLQSFASRPSSTTSLETSQESEDGDGIPKPPKVWEGPPCVFAIPGNHDWFDGLDTYMQCICYRDWLGGWRMPQTKSYFALQLAHGWWVFALDFALEDDIDGLQFQYFASIAAKYLQEDDQVIIVCHEPTWVLDAYLNHPHPEDAPFSRTSKNVKQLMRRHLRGRVALRIAGDIHNYMRDDAVQPLSNSALRAGAAPVLVVAGGGGAFLHPTHTFPSSYKETGARYERKASYPSVSQSRAVSMKNLGQGFRMQNWKFDIIGATVYFLLVVSFFPRCQLDHILAPRLYPDGFSAFFGEVATIFSEIWTDSVVSLITTLCIFATTCSFADNHYGLFRQVMIGAVHTMVHVFCAITFFLLLEIVVELSIRDGLAGQGYDSFFQSFEAFERRKMPESYWTSGFLVSLLKTMLRMFDLPENMATTRVRVCRGEVDAPGLFSSPTCSAFANATLRGSGLTRFDLVTYYTGNFLYLSIIVSDVVAMVLGLYLFVCVNFMQLHWNEAFSSIRSPDFKSFVRFKIDKDGNLHGYAIGIDRVPRKWREDSRWRRVLERLLTARSNKEAEEVDELDPSIASYGSKYPSRWIPAYQRSRKARREQEPHIIDYFCIPRKRRWVKPRRGKSALNTDWWDAFGELERRKLFHKTSSTLHAPGLAGGSSRRVVTKSQSPASGRPSLHSLGRPESLDFPPMEAGHSDPASLDLPSSGPLSTLKRGATALGLLDPVKEPAAE